MDFGRLSNKTPVTGSDGVARVTYTAPPAPVEPVDSFTVVTLVISPVGGDFHGSNPRYVELRLVPKGVILPPNGAPQPLFIITPTPVFTRTPVTFDASGTRDEGVQCGSRCIYSWDFGDGSSGTGMAVSHEFNNPATYAVRLTVTDARGQSVTTSQSVTVEATPAPTAEFTYLPGGAEGGPGHLLQRAGLDGGAGPHAGRLRLGLRQRPHRHRRDRRQALRYAGDLQRDPQGARRHVLARRHGGDHQGRHGGGALRVDVAPSRIDDLRRRVEADPASIAFAQLAEEYRRAGQTEEAVRVCREGLTRHPGYLSARVTLGRALLDLGQLDDARLELQFVASEAPENLAAVRGLAEIFHREGDAAAALEHFQRALALARHDPELEEIVQQLSRQVGAEAGPSNGLTFEEAHQELLSAADRLPPVTSDEPATTAADEAGGATAPFNFDTLVAALGTPAAPPQVEAVVQGETPPVFELPELPDRGPTRSRRSKRSCAGRSSCRESRRLHPRRCASTSPRPRPRPRRTRTWMRRPRNG